MRKRVIFMFSGQGSQYYQMGRELFEHNAVFRRHVQELDALGTQFLGSSLVRIIYEDSRPKWDPFERVLLTSPALFMIQYALAQTVMQDGLEPDVLLGSSLGTFVAAAVGGCVSMVEGLRNVIDLARVVEERCPQGGMLAILAHPDLYRQDGVLRAHGELAGINFDAHFVLAGSTADLRRVEAALRARNIAYQPIAVSRAFHSRLIDAAELPCRELFRGIQYQRSSLPIACTAQVALLDTVNDRSLWRVAREPIRFRDTIDLLERDGEVNLYVDLGPSGTLATFVRYHLGESARSRVEATLSPFGGDVSNYQRAVSKVRAATGR
jgi:acyl transferase domain-containing protein